MSSTLIFGGNGKVARYLTTKLLAAEPGATVHSIIRSESQCASLRALGASPIVASIEDNTRAQLTATIEQASPDAVVWAAGAGGKGPPERTVTVDFEGAVKAMDAFAAAKTGKPKRFVLVSAIDVRDREGRPVPSWYTEEDVGLSEKAWKALTAYYKAKLDADKELVKGNKERGLEYTIVRPGYLSDAPAEGMVRAGKVGLNGSITREDVASVILASLKNKGTIGLAFDVLGDGDGALSPSDAVAKVVEKKEDCFEGRLRYVRNLAPDPTDENGEPQVHLPLPDRDVPPGSDPVREFPVLHLHSQAYAVHSLVDLSIRSFTDHNSLSPEQLLAKRLMIRAMLRSVDELPHKSHTIYNLIKFARCVDTYFFLGTLTTGRLAGLEGAGRRPVVQLGQADEAHQAQGKRFYIERWDPRRCMIMISTRMLKSQPGFLFEKFGGFAGLIRAMAKAYLDTFGCVCSGDGTGRCFRKIPSTVGITGKGYCWQVLMAKIVEQIRGWDHRLRRFSDHRVDEYCVDIVAQEREDEHWEALTEMEDWMRLVDDRREGTEGEHGFTRRPPRVVQRRAETGLRREADELAREARAFRWG
ncbi:uncharacterized protein DNG_01791 [Cephalotrichum gorgonifer]|uniref:NAD(P)-binding domain-containing protein n=1 Tax=Cephalotrichum gorgonifer TaxID=2041049 RepID=A0AAE8MSG1_9PEZI|nr:uncharacterized protein DNG_01791 [Cephalotrichum gorgonifer]